MNNIDKYKNELPYWMVLAHLPKMYTSRKTELVIEFYTRKLNIIDFFTSERDNWEAIYKVSEDEKHLLDSAISELANYAFLAEDLLNQGYKIIPIISEEYSKTLKLNLKKNSPILLYTKGNTNIMSEQTIAIVGSRKASDVSLEFTDNVAKKASAEYKVVVSGFAKGVDKQALDSAINYKGQSIIVLPQGITTFSSGFKKYYNQILKGDVLVVSTFHPKAPWKVELAMSRNAIIYGLSKEIYVAESDNKGGTWAGATAGIKKKNTVYIRCSNMNENNANMELISLGGIPVDMFGDVTSIDEKASVSIEERVVDLLTSKHLSSDEIIMELELDWTPRKMTTLLNKMENVMSKTIKSKKVFFVELEQHSLSLF